jgi:hypothetical protein
MPKIILKKTKAKGIISKYSNDKKNDENTRYCMLNWDVSTIAQASGIQRGKAQYFP